MNRILVCMFLLNINLAFPSESRDLSRSTSEVSLDVLAEQPPQGAESQTSTGGDQTDGLNLVPANNSRSVISRERRKCICRTTTAFMSGAALMFLVTLPAIYTVISRDCYAPNYYDTCVERNNANPNRIIGSPCNGTAPYDILPLMFTRMGNACKLRMLYTCSINDSRNGVIHDAEYMCHDNNTQNYCAECSEGPSDSSRLSNDQFYCGFAPSSYLFLDNGIKSVKRSNLTQHRMAVDRKRFGSGR